MVIGDYLLMIILLVAINGYLLMIINNYCINGYFKLNYHRLLMNI
jgi:hypothetical protein